MAPTGQTLVYQLALCSIKRKGKKSHLNTSRTKLNSSKLSPSVSLVNKKILFASQNYRTICQSNS